MSSVKIKKFALIVEDQASIAELIAIVLKKEGFKTQICSQGRQVEAAVLKYRPSIILMDLWIPGIDGMKLTKKLKSGMLTKNIPIIIISAQNFLPKIVSAVKADGFLAKPFNIDDLVAIVNKYARLTEKL